MKAYKGFNKDMTCNPNGKVFQFEEGKTYEEAEAKLCESGFHACENPLDCWGYYDFLNSVVHEVELDDVCEERGKDTKICARKIRIGARLDVRGIVKASVDFVMESVKECFEKKLFDKKTVDNKNSAKIGSSGDSAKIGSSGDSAQIGSSGDYAQIGSSGYSAQIGSSGNSAKIGSSGDSAKIGSSGDYAKIGSSGYYAQIGSSGYSAKIGSSGYYAQIGSSGYYAQIGSSGDYAKIGSSGDSAKIDITGNRSVGACVGNNGKIKAKKGCWIVLSEWKAIDGEYTPVCVKAAQVDGDKVKEDTWYKLENGELVEEKE